MGMTLDKGTKSKTPPIQSKTSRKVTYFSVLSTDETTTLQPITMQPKSLSLTISPLARRLQTPKHW